MMKKQLRLFASALALFRISVASVFGADEAIVQTEAALEEGRLGDAMETISAYVETRSEDAYAQFLLGRILYESGEYERADQALRTSLEIDDRNAEAHAYLGSTIVKRAEQLPVMKSGALFMKSLSEYKKAVEIDPDNLHGQIGLCRYYWNAPPIGGGSMKKAKLHAAEVMRLDPYLGHTEFALIAKKQRDRKTAIERFTKMIEMKPDELWVRLELGKLHRKLGDVEKAKAEFEAILEVDPDHEDAKKGMASLESGARKE